MTLPDAIVPGHKTNSHYSLKERQAKGTAATEGPGGSPEERWTHAPVQLNRAGGKLAGLPPGPSMAAAP